MASPKALIFDFDGLIVDTETPLYDSWRQLFQEHGHDLALETYVQCVGSTIQRFDPITHLESLVGETLESSALEISHSARRDRVEAALAESDTLPGVRELLSSATEAGFKIALASSSTSDWIDPWLARLGIRDHFQVVRTLSHVSAAKPSPELFLAAAELLEVSPEEALVFEDSHNGLTAAIAASIPCVIVPNAVTKLSDFSQAHLVLESLAERSLPDILESVRTA